MNYHTWTNPNTNRKNKKKLPPGRYLKIGDMLEATDLMVCTDSPPESPYSDDLGRVVKGWWYKDLYYRPFGIPQYRILKPGEIVRNGDQMCTLSKRWIKACVTVGYPVESEDLNKGYKWRRRKHVKARRRRKV